MSNQQIQSAVRQWYSGGWPRLYAQLRTQLYGKRFERLLEFIPKSGRLVDAGCGFGLVTNLISLERPMLELIGIDTDHRRIRAAQQSIGQRRKIRFEVADVRTFAFQPSDVILFIDSLHRIPRNAHAALLRRLHHQLQRQGSLVIADVNDIPRWKYVLTCAVDALLYPFSPHGQFRNTADLTALASSAGWQLRTSTPTDAGGIFSTITHVFDAR